MRYGTTTTNNNDDDDDDDDDWLGWECTWVKSLLLPVAIQLINLLHVL